jgi:hypothetical protein
VELWDLTTGRHERTLETPAGVTDLAFSQDGRELYIGLWGDTPVGVWNLERATFVTLLSEKGGRSEAPWGVRLASGGATFLVGRGTSGSALEQAFEIWSRETRERLLDVVPVRGGAWLALSPVGALDGSEQARGAVLAIAKSPIETRAFPGEVAWDASWAPQLVTRALAGERVAPLGL